MKNPHGMLLVTGPTGSGKTTTIYSMVKILNTKDVHIASIEDPVEYDISGVSQIQVNQKTNLTFAKGLRAIVRQDPDLIVVGEIRDEETAGIAVNSAMTGHLVLSTLHTNDAVTALPRLLDMKIEPFLIASTVNLIVAQRLVRKICQKCRISTKLTKGEIDILSTRSDISEFFVNNEYGPLSKLTVYKGTGCEGCGDTGYSGRIGVFEVLEMSDDVRKLVIDRSSSDVLLKSARENGMSTIVEDSLKKVMQGITTMEEVIRVTKI